MPAFAVRTAAHHYEAVVERGILARLHQFLPPRAGRLFVVTTEDVWRLHGEAFTRGLAGRDCHRIVFAGGEDHKRLSSVEAMADQMLAAGGDRSSLIIAFGGGIVNDLGGFLAAIFMRGIGVVQVPTTLLAQVDAGVGGKTGANLTGGKNLIGAFHQPLAVLVDPAVLETLPEREYRAGLQEIVKCGVIRSEPLFRLMERESGAVLARDAASIDRMIAESVQIKCDVVSADERESDLRRILNYGHTVGHALEAETGYTHFLHGEAVGVGMKAAAHLSRLTGRLTETDARTILDTVGRYGPFPSLRGISVERVASRLVKDKKTVQGSVHFVLATRIGEVEVVTGLAEPLVREAIRCALA
jgi:3-dehydroquinate synthase